MAPSCALALAVLMSLGLVAPALSCPFRSRKLEVKSLDSAPPHHPSSHHHARLSPSFYAETCPDFLTIVEQVLRSSTAVEGGQNNTALIPARVLRLMFHDCMVVGCDASNLLLPLNNTDSERDADDNAMFGGMTGGFTFIFKIKAALEAACPNVVSCADVVVGAGFKSLEMVNPTISSKVSLGYGRRDAITSFVFNPDMYLAHQWYTPSQVKHAFAQQNFTPKDYVALLGAHTMGTSNCWRFYSRLGATIDPNYDPAYGKWLNDTCIPPSVSGNAFWPWIPLDNVTDTVFDNQYYKNVLNRRGLLKTDDGLIRSSVTLPYVKRFAKHPTAWYDAFAAAFEKLSMLNVLTGTQGEVRTNCEYVNQPYIPDPHPLGGLGGGFQ